MSATDGREAREGGPLGSVLRLKPGETRAALWLLALLGVGLVLLTRPAGGAGPRAPATSPPAAAPGDPLGAEAAAIDQRLASVLGEIAGVGPVTVAVDLATGPWTAYATDTQTTDSATSQPEGAASSTDTQSSSSTQVVLAGDGTPAVQGVEAPRIEGVLVVARGAADPVVAEEITQAVQAATGVPAYRIVVLPQAGGG